ncbi:hypothetical protein BXZ70DRAFT_705236 [Cristinia sonorae]|uniref:Uncharacterized protein n=1 Tax=Cristinia sonorae TaxID=1940300 RepID=A0A8K0UD44_9AGAR|nr:hypothetical protein BXZ70DRAFT_705236 [Cristinia sonorae]
MVARHGSFLGCVPPIWCVTSIIARLYSAPTHAPGVGLSWTLSPTPRILKWCSCSYAVPPHRRPVITRAKDQCTSKPCYLYSNLSNALRGLCSSHTVGERHECTKYDGCGVQEDDSQSTEVSEPQRAISDCSQKASTSIAQFYLSLPIL